jgi:hypothetical protein
MITTARAVPSLSTLVLAVVLVLWSFARAVCAQTVGTGTIVGTLTDPSGLVISGAKVTIANTATGQIVELATNSSGTFNSGALIPGDYKVQVSMKGFSPSEAAVTMLVGNTATVNLSLQIGPETQAIQVYGTEIRVNTEQPTVQGVLTAQIENLPFSGRDFLDLAQLEPGVQIQDGSNFGFGSKDGYSSISFGGRFGHTARIEVDGIDLLMR